MAIEYYAINMFEIQQINYAYDARGDRRGRLTTHAEEIIVPSGEVQIFLMSGTFGRNDFDEYLRTKGLRAMGNGTCTGIQIRIPRVMLETEGLFAEGGYELNQQQHTAYRIMLEMLCDGQLDRMRRVRFQINERFGGLWLEKVADDVNSANFIEVN